MTITAYFHCRKCVEENLPPRIDAGIDETGETLIVQCRTHDIPVGTFQLKEPMKGVKCAFCDDPNHKH